jgi:hypothetical protein
MKNKLLFASLLAVLSAAATAQTAQTAQIASKPSASPTAAGKPGAAPVNVPDVASHQIARFYLNNDGKVSRDEFLKPAQANFKRTDLNGDGFVTAPELSEFGKRQMAEFTKMREKTIKEVADATTKPGVPAAAEKPAK